MVRDVWDVGDAYEAYVGRWSRRVAREFVTWLAVPRGGLWLDAGCGTGALSAAARESGAARVLGVDPSLGFLRQNSGDRAAGDARALPLRDGRFDAVVSGLALNFVPGPARAAAEFARVAAPGGTVAAYVWDYAEGMTMMRLFWDAAAEADPDGAMDEGTRFPLCRPDPLAALWADAGLGEVAVRAVEVPTVFSGWDDYWQPFLGGQGAAPAYLAGLDEQTRVALREALRRRVPVEEDGSIRLTARAWAVRGVRP
ncbi:class I SAM-dependent methyltransferase [Couchioplanes caeruleus]|uniref:class I SAM-dependent methyltransferase n=1 Tax=Couchioplanes caeruleus TaxID=56438 RepID=UPI0020C1355D|nr:class I SAM-dependent methyltransferase [Couchioplanes caeruleus]UQU67938.1 class I SAM-dependent methyltransferase [Couchioplanes caeruleus]